MNDTFFEPDGDSDGLLATADALDRVRQQAKSLLDRGLVRPRAAADGPADPDVGKVNLVPFRWRTPAGPDGDPAFRGAAADYLDDLYHPLPVTGERLRQIAPAAGAKADAYAPYLDSAMTLGGILTPSQRAAFLGQVGAETGDMTPRRESLNYSDPQRAANIFHRAFRGDPEQARPYLGNSEKMANRAYASRMGNGDEGSGDGYAYRGGGFLQITGRKGYREVGLEDHPEEIERPDIAARASVDHWLARGLNDRTFEPIESQKAFDAVTWEINKGRLQGQQRWEAYGRGLRALSKPARGRL